jgi:L-ascorbate metabolism protein UlaG (beta-lactamase superfamily)
MKQLRIRKSIAPLVLWAMLLLIPGSGMSYCHEIEMVRNPALRLAAANDGRVQIKWFGHATFQITSSKGTRILTDPHTRDYLPVPTLPQHIVTTSHNHGAHSNIWMAPGDPIVIEGLSQPDDDWKAIQRIIKDVSIYTVPAYHDKSQGLQRGKNSIFVFRVDNICIAHLGDLGHSLTPAQLKMLGKIDILLVPLAGGRFTIPADEAREVTKQVGPRIAIPMHYWSEGAVENYIQGNPQVRKINGPVLRISDAELPEPTEVVVLSWSDL